MKSNYFIVGDIHGCYYSLRKLLAYWDKKSTLIFIGDYIDRGNFSYEVVEYLMSLKEEYKDQVLVLLGNHEYEFITYHRTGDNMNWLTQGGLKTLNAYKNGARNPEKHLAFFTSLDCSYEDHSIFVSHAGLNKDIENPFDFEDPDSLIWNRGPIKQLEKLQVRGHTPRKGQPVYNVDENCYHIDTACVYGGHLTGLKIEDGEISFIQVPVDERDVID
jgi:serine/threonine protein phosphatase 1